MGALRASWRWFARYVLGFSDVYPDPDDRRYPRPGWLRLLRWLAGRPWWVLLAVYVPTIAPSVLTALLEGTLGGSTDLLHLLLLDQIVALGTQHPWVVAPLLFGLGLVIVLGIRAVSDEQREQQILGARVEQQGTMGHGTLAESEQRSARRAQESRLHMLNRLHRTYEQLLAETLEGVAWLDLGLAQQPDAVQNATTLLLRRAKHAEQLLLPGTSIIEAYEGSAHEVLILGEPGAGKSTLLLQLASYLVEQAKQNGDQPLPVLLPLASWAVSRLPLEDWLVDQVDQIYDIDKQIVRGWVQANHLLLLLDGLDEMNATEIPACIDMINIYHHAHPGPLVVCCRTAEYVEITQKHSLTLQNAVAVQPLTPKQVNDYLAQVGQPLEGLTHALKKNAVLRDLARTPLMLSVLAVTYQGKSVRLVGRKAAELHQQVWTDYVHRMVERKGNAMRYPLERTCAWLHWLAIQLREHNQAIFYLEHLQPTWLPAESQRAYAWLAIRLPGILIGVLVSLTLPLILFGPRNLPTLLHFAILGGFLGGFLSGEVSRKAAVHRLQTPQPRTTWYPLTKRAVISAGIGFVSGVSFDFAHTGLGLDSALDYLKYLELGPWPLGSWLRDGGIFGLSWWVLLSGMPRIAARQAAIKNLPMAPGKLTFRSVLHTVSGQRALLVATVLGVGSGLSYGLSEEASFGWSVEYSGLIYALGLGLSYTLFTWLLFGFTSVLISFILKEQAGVVHLTERLKWTWGSLIRSLFAPRHLRATLVLAGFVFIVAGLSHGLLIGSNIGWLSVLAFWLSGGIGMGLSVGIGFWVLLGLFQGIAPEQVKDQDRRRLNQGIHRSLRNGLIMGFISGGIIGIVGTLGAGLSFGLRRWLEYGVSYGPDGLIYGVNWGLRWGLGVGLSFGQEEGWLLAVSSGLLVCAMMGGMAVLRHAVLRLLLWHRDTFPWRAALFLDDARARILVRHVGGGYRFFHRQLLDYFADLQVVSSTPSTPASPTPSFTP